MGQGMMRRLMTERRTDGRKDWRMDGRTDGWTNRQTERKKERRTDGRTYVELFHPMAIQPSLNAIAAESKAPLEKQNSAIFSYFPKRTGEEPPVVVLLTHTLSLSPTVRTVRSQGKLLWTHTLSLSHCPYRAESGEASSFL
jgi:hypothetical protein